jgi:hypothetical protein
MITIIFLWILFNLLFSLPFNNIKKNAPWINNNSWKLWIFNIIKIIFSISLIFLLLYYVSHIFLTIDFYIIIEILNFIFKTINAFIKIFNQYYFKFFILIIQVLLLLPIIFFIIDWKFSKYSFVKTLQIILLFVLGFMLLIYSLNMITDIIFRFFQFDIIKYSSDFLNYWFNSWIYSLLSDNFGLAFLNSDEIVLNLSSFSISGCDI